MINTELQGKGIHAQGIHDFWLLMSFIVSYFDADVYELRDGTTRDHNSTVYSYVSQIHNHLRSPL